jgi:hypothetical protein
MVILTKKAKILYVIFLVFLSFLWHNLYKWFPNNFFAIVFPVNESIWEHMKIIFGCFIFGSIFEKYLLNKFNYLYNNLALEVITKGLLGVIFYLIIYIPIYNLFGYSLFFSIMLLIITFIIMEFIGTIILQSDNFNINIIPIVLIFLVYILFAILTFYPKYSDIFFDNYNFVYGIPKN